MKKALKRQLVVAIGPASFAEEDKTPLQLLHDCGVKVKPNPFGRRLIESEIIELDDVKYRYVSLYHDNIWHGYSWNPGLRRLSDYKLVAPFSKFIKPNDFAALTECRIGQRYFELGFRSVILLEGYVKIIP